MEALNPGQAARTRVEHQTFCCCRIPPAQKVPRFPATGTEDHADRTRTIHVSITSSKCSRPPAKSSLFTRLLQGPTTSFF